MTNKLVIFLDKNNLYMVIICDITFMSAVWELSTSKNCWRLEWKMEASYTKHLSSHSIFVSFLVIWILSLWELWSEFYPFSFMQPITALEHCEWLNKLLMEVWPYFINPKFSTRFSSIVEVRPCTTIYFKIHFCLCNTENMQPFCLMIYFLLVHVLFIDV